MVNTSDTVLSFRGLIFVGSFGQRRALFTGSMPTCVYVLQPIINPTMALATSSDMNGDSLRLSSESTSEAPTAFFHADHLSPC